MPRYSLRTLLIQLAIGPPLVALYCPLAFAQDGSDPGKALYGEWKIVEMVYRTHHEDLRDKSAGWFFFEPEGFLYIHSKEHRDAVFANKRYKEQTTERYIVKDGTIDIMAKGIRKGGVVEIGWLYARYDLNKDTLRVVWGKERPSEFDEAYKNRDLTLYVLKKVK